MTSEKRSIDKDNLIFNVSAVVVDIEGTTTSINFVKETLFPYVREHLEEYINNKWSEKELQEDISLLREQAIKDSADKVEGVVGIPEGDSDEIKKALIKNILWQMDGDRKTKALKQLQGHIWRSGYSSGKLVGHLFGDVKECLKSWNEAGKNIYVYSSGSVEAQKLLFGNTKVGDLLSIFSGFFDTEVGSKTESSSYIKIVEKLKENGHVTGGAKDILFLTDVSKEAQAAVDAGLQSVLVLREGNAPLSEEVKGSFPTISSFSDISFEGNAKRRKLSNETDNVENNELIKENVEGSNDSVKDEEMEVCSNENNAVSESVTVNNSSDDTTEPVLDSAKANPEETSEAESVSLSVNSEKNTENNSDLAIVGSEKSSKTISDAVSSSLNGSAERTPTPVNTKSEDLTNTSPTSNSIVSKEAKSAPDSVNVNNSEDSNNVADIVKKGSVDESVAPKADSEDITKNEPAVDETKTSLQHVTSSEDGPKIGNAIEVSEETKLGKLVNKEVKNTDDNISSNECSQKENGMTENGPLVKNEVNNDRTKDESNVPDSTVESEDIEMKEVEVKELEKDVKGNEGKVAKDFKESENKTELSDSPTTEESAKKIGPSDKQDMEAKENIKVEESSKNDVEMKEKPEPDVKNKTDAEKHPEVCQSETGNKPEVVEQHKENESISDKSTTGSQTKPSDELKSNDIQKDIEDKQVTENKEAVGNKEMESKENTENKINVSDYDGAKKDSPVTETSEPITDVNKEENSLVKDSGTSIVDSSMEVDNKETIDEKSIFKGQEESKKDIKEVNGESENIGDTTLKESNAGVENKTVDKVPTITHDDEKADKVVDKTENNKADDIKVDNKEKIGDTNSEVLNKGVDADANKETEDNKTDLNNITPNGTHETCKNGMNEENDNIGESNVKEKLVAEKVKESCIEQKNGVETAGEV